MGIYLIGIICIVVAVFISFIIHLIDNIFGWKLISINKDFLIENNVYTIMSRNNNRLNLMHNNRDVYLQMEECTKGILMKDNYGILRLYIDGKEVSFLEYNGAGIVRGSGENLMPVDIKKPYKKEIEKVFKEEYKQIGKDAQKVSRRNE